MVERAFLNTRCAGCYGHGDFHKAALVGHIDSVRKTAVVDKAAAAAAAAAVDIDSFGHKAVGTFGPAVGLGRVIAVDLVDLVEEVEVACCIQTVAEDTVNAIHRVAGSLQANMAERRAGGRMLEDRATASVGFPAAWETDTDC